MTSIVKTLGIAILGSALAGTTAMANDTHVNFMNSSELTGTHTYTLRNLHATDPMLEPRLAIAIDRNLQENGWKETANGDVLVTAVLASNYDPQLYGDFYGNLNDLNWNTANIDPPGDAPQSVEQAPAGTLIVDMYDARTGALIWRSTAGDFLTNNTDDDVLKVDEAVNEMFQAMPWDAPAVNYDPWQHFPGSI